MTNPTPTDWRALCAELLDALENAIRVIYREDGTKHISTADAVITKADTALAQPELQEPPKNCWLDDEPDLCPSPCVFDDPSEVISNCVYAQQVKCKTDCRYYRNALAQPEPQQEANR